MHTNVFGSTKEDEKNCSKIHVPALKLFALKPIVKKTKKKKLQMGKNI